MTWTSKRIISIQVTCYLAGSVVSQLVMNPAHDNFEGKNEDLDVAASLLIKFHNALVHSSQKATVNDLNRLYFPFLNLTFSIN